MATPRPARPGRPKGTGADPRKVRERILAYFVERAAREGIRAVALADIARDLQMSLATIYRHFPSKRDLVAAAVYGWVRTFAAAGAVLDRQHDIPDAATGLALWARQWAAREQQFCPAFWSDLRSGYPDLWREFRAANQRMRAAGKALLAPHLRDDIDRDLAFELFYVMFRHISDPATLERLGLDRHAATETATKLWAGGALADPGTLGPEGGEAR